MTAPAPDQEPQCPTCKAPAIPSADQTNLISLHCKQAYARTTHLAQKLQLIQKARRGGDEATTIYIQGAEPPSKKFAAKGLEQDNKYDKSALFREDQRSLSKNATSMLARGYLRLASVRIGGRRLLPFLLLSFFGIYFFWHFLSPSSYHLRQVIDSNDEDPSAAAAERAQAASIWAAGGTMDDRQSAYEQNFGGEPEEADELVAARREDAEERT